MWFFPWRAYSHVGVEEVGNKWSKIDEYNKCNKKADTTIYQQSLETCFRYMVWEGPLRRWHLNIDQKDEKDTDIQKSKRRVILEEMKKFIGRACSIPRTDMKQLWYGLWWWRESESQVTLERWAGPGDAAWWSHGKELRYSLRIMGNHWEI